VPLEGTLTIEPKYVKGDVDADGELTVSDIVLAERFIAGRNVYLPNREAGDIYKDNKIDQIDIEFMKKELLKVN
jgi:hypothetical protein